MEKIGAVIICCLLLFTHVSAIEIVIVPCYKQEIDPSSCILMERCELSWKTFFWNTPRYKTSNLTVNKIVTPSKIKNKLFGLFEWEKPVTSLQVWGVNKSKKIGLIIKRYDWVKLPTSLLKENNTQKVWKIDCEDLSKFDVIVIIPNPGLLDNEFWLEITKSDEV